LNSHKKWPSNGDDLSQDNLHLGFGLGLRFPGLKSHVAVYGTMVPPEMLLVVTYMGYMFLLSISLIGSKFNIAKVFCQLSL
jgi:hypothetical protein